MASNFPSALTLVLLVHVFGSLARLNLMWQTQQRYCQMCMGSGCFKMMQV